MRVRNILGIVAGVLILLSSLAHLFAGWPGLRAELVKAGAGVPLLQGVSVVWFFAGGAMVAMGALLVWLFWRRHRGDAVSRVPAAIVAALYVPFGAWALWMSGFEWFYLVFLVPGLLAAVAASGGDARG